MSIRNHNLRTLKSILQHVSESEESIHVCYRQVRVSQVINWDAVFSDTKLITAVIIYAVFMVAQLLLSYAGFVYFDVENKPTIYTISMIFNIVASYFYPVLISSLAEENIDNPFQDLNREIKCYEGFFFAVIIQIISFSLSLWSTIVLFQTTDLVLLDYDYITRSTVRINVTNPMRVFQLTSLSLSFFGLLMAIVNFWVTRNKLVRYLNRIERKRFRDRIPYRQPFNPIILPDDFYDKYLKTLNRSYGEVAS